MKNNIINVIGLQYGDEGKGRVSHFLADEDTISVRYNGGGNSYHIILGPKGPALSSIPVGSLKGAISIIHTGSVINIDRLEQDLSFHKNNSINKDKLFISEKAHIVTDKHLKDNKSTSGKSSGGFGITQCVVDKWARKGVRAIDVKDTLLKSYNVINTDDYLLKSYKEGKKIIMEGAQGFLLDIDFGTYPNISSSNSTTAYLPFTRPDRIIGVFKTYMSRVFSDVKINNVDNKDELLYKLGMPQSYQLAETELEQIKYAAEMNGCTELAIIALDLVDNQNEYIKNVEEYTGLPVTIISYGKGHDEIISI